MNLDRVECIIVGAGVIGLAVARALAARGREVLVLEAATSFGQGISSRNSEVIHAGIHYPRGSLKAGLCVRGRRLLYRYCESRGISHRRCGKLIVATSVEQHDVLLALQRQGIDNDVQDLVLLDAEQTLRLEPELHCTLALLSPSTGIVDSHAFMLSLLGDAERDGASVAYRCPVTGGRISRDGIVLAVGGAAPTEIAASAVINCAGLGAQRVASGIEGIAKEAIPPLHRAKGNYFALSGRPPFTRLIYPVPHPGGLGVHLTLDLAGQARFGPDVEWIDEEDYDVSPRRASAFYGEIRRYWPALRDGTLNPAYAGIRPKLRGAGGGDADFVVQAAAQHGVGGLINLFGIESPGLTAALAIGDMIADLTEFQRDAERERGKQDGVQPCLRLR